MKKIRVGITLVIALAFGFILIGGIQSIYLKAETPSNVGVINEVDVPDWVNGHEVSVKQKFIDAYTDAGFTLDPDGTIQPYSFGQHKRVALIQSFGTEGIILLNEREGTPLVVTDQNAIAELQSLLVPANDYEKGILLDIVQSGGSTYFVTDRRYLDGIFKMIDDPENPGTEIADYLNYRIGIGSGTYADIMWVEYTKAYKLAAQFMGPLGLPLDAVAKYRYTTPDLNLDGEYILSEGDKVLSEKVYTAQQFENGWIIQARMQVLKDPVAGTLGGMQAVQHGAAPIMNDMYALVTALQDNSDFSVTGAPVSLEYNIGDIRYQNFEYGYVKIEAGVATFVPDLVVDDQATEMNRIIGISRTWDNIRVSHADNNPVHGIGWERLRISQNFRNVVGELIRDGILTETLTDGQIIHSGVNAPQDGIWFSFRDAKNPDGTTAPYLGAANYFVFHTSWYDDARPLLPYLNTPQFVDAKDGIGRPIDAFKSIYNVYYQEFKGGIGYRDSKPGSVAQVVFNADLNTWLDGSATIEDALVAKGLAEATHDVTFKDHDDSEIAVVNVNHGEAAIAPTDPVRDNYTFTGWSETITNVLYDTTVTASYTPVEYTITYDLDGGTNHVDNPDTANVLSNIELKAPEKTDFIFVGWYSDPGFTTPITHLTEINDNTTIYARFVETMTAEEIVGTFAPGTTPDWVKGYETSIKAEFLSVYNSENFTEVPYDYIKSIDLGKARVMLYQVIPNEGAIIITESEGKAIFTKNIDALDDYLATLGTENESIILDIFTQSDVEYFVTDENIFSYDTEGVMQVHANKIGVGDADYADVTWIEYTKAYEMASNYMESLGLPLTAVTRHRYTTSDMNSNGTYKKTDEVINTSEKEHTAQQFENGWIIHARVRILNPDGSLGGNQVVQHGAAPILNDMYAAVIALTDNATLNVTGAPVSIEFTVGSVRYQNFEYGYVKLEGGIATFIPEAVIDSQGTEMTRRVGIGESWNNWNTAANQNYGLIYERLRVGQNFRELVGQMIRDGRTPFAPSETDVYGDTRMFHRGTAAPAGLGVWFSGKDGEGSFLGAANVFMYQTHWYMPAFELAPVLNTALYVDAKDNIGRPVDEFVRFYNVIYQEFEGGIGYKDITPGAEGPISVIGSEALNTWLDPYDSIEAALLGKGIAETHHDVVFKDREGNILETITVAHGDPATAPEAPVIANYTFDKWSVAFDDVIYDITVEAQYKPIEYTITYNLDGGTNHVDNPTTANILSNIELKAAEKTDFIFVGWYLEDSFETPITNLTAVDSNMTIYAYFTDTVSASEIVGAFAAGTSPNWVKGYEAVIKDEFERIYDLADFTEVPDAFVQSVELNRTRVMVYQIIPNEGAIIMNERDGKAMFTKNVVGINAYLDLIGTEFESILLGIVTANDIEYFITDDGIFYFTNEGKQTHTYSVGIGAELAQFDSLGAEFTEEAVLNDFAIAYKFAENFMASLGLPTSAVTMADYTTIDLNPVSGKPLNPSTTSAKQYYLQAFENGYIMMNSHGENIQYGAAPILKDFYDLVTAITGNADFSVTGTPVSTEMTIEGVRYQNFEFGYVKIVEGVAEFVEGWVVDSQGYELNRRVGTPTRFINWHWDTKNREEYLVGWERLRITQNIRNSTADLFRAGLTPYIVSETDPFGDSGIHDLTSRAGGSSGLWHIFKDVEGWPALGWGNAFLLQGYWYNQPYFLSPLFNVGEFVDDKGMGRPITPELTLYNATYQVFDDGIGYFNGVEIDDQPNWVSVKGADFVTWMGSHQTVEDALLAHGIAEATHKVTWYAQDGVTVIREDQVNHGEAATPPEAPAIDGLVFSSWSPESYDSILLPNREFVAVYGSETGQPQSGSYKFISYDSDGLTATFWYEESTNIITVNETLFNAFRASKLTMEESIAVNGLPIYADENNLITTLYHFQIDETDDTVVIKLNTIGYLDETVTSLKNGTVEVTLDDSKKLIIQDSFGDAYIFTWDRGGHLLGLPLGPAEIQKLYPNPDVESEYIDVIVQEFENGFIMQEVYDNAAYSIYGVSYDEWLLLEGFAGLGTPTSRQFEYEGVIYQNFKYGYLVIDGGTATPTFTESVQLDFKGRPISKVAGRTESRANVKIGHEDFEGEILRVYEAYMQLYTDMKDAGLMFDHAIESVHEWNGASLTQGFNPSLSTANVWGQANFTVAILESPYKNAVLVKDEILVQYSLLDGNKTFGFPVANSFVVDVTVEFEGADVELEVTYQNFTAGYIRTYLVGDTFVYEYYRDAEITAEGVHMVEGVAEETPEWDLSGLSEEPGIDKAELETKLAELKTERAKVEELIGDIKDLPSNKLYASKTLLDEVDAKVLEIEALLENEEATDAEVTQALVELDALITKLVNQSQPGESDPVTEPEDDDGLSTAGIVGIVAGSVTILAGAVLVVFKFVIKRRP